MSTDTRNFIAALLAHWPVTIFLPAIFLMIVAFIVVTIIWDRHDHAAAAEATAAPAAVPAAAVPAATVSAATVVVPSVPAPDPAAPTEALPTTNGTRPPTNGVRQPQQVPGKP